MTHLSSPVLPLIPSAFATGDRISCRGCTYVRLASGIWECPPCGPASFTINDEAIRSLFVQPGLLDAMGSVPLFAPASVPAGTPLPGRPVLAGERPFEPGRPYLLSSTDDTEDLAGVPNDKPGPWGIAQATIVSSDGGPSSGNGYDVSLAETGTVFIRTADKGVTLAYTPAEEPTAEEASVLSAHQVVRDLMAAVLLLHGF
ncbi:hypothetical protein [Streptomyces sp. NPDC088915]|uniref:hypothetical protein n=1 Tax=Streptomyces sp. NPDC088915 TaxID=3365912 RepID=UPI003829BB1B